MASWQSSAPKVVKARKGAPNRRHTVPFPPLVSGGAAEHHERASAEADALSCLSDEGDLVAATGHEPADLLAVGSRTRHLRDGVTAVDDDDPVRQGEDLVQLG